MAQVTMDARTAATRTAEAARYADAVERECAEVAEELRRIAIRLKAISVTAHTSTIRAREAMEAADVTVLALERAQHTQREESHVQANP